MAKRTPPSSRRILAGNLRRLRLESEMSQDDVAAEAGVRQALVSAIEVETANPTLETLDRVAAALGVDLAKLFERTGR